jgi:CubicO group peptidase (beta-lactamase class C family)
MRFGWLVALTTVGSLVLWALLVIGGTLDAWWRKPLAPADDARAFLEASIRYIDTNFHGNVAYTLIEDGEVYGEHYVSIGAPVDRDTLFQVASLSKWITAWGVMSLVQAGRLDLDAPVSRYLTRWSLPPSEFDNDGVTVRRLLSHTAGLTDGLGYEGFAPGTDAEPLEASLTHAADASPGKDGRVRVGTAPGSQWQYSGGGYTLLQLLIEEVSGETFSRYMRRAIFEPLRMSRSTFSVDVGVTPNVATFYDTDGSPATHYRFTALAAASLYTTAADMTAFVQAQVAKPHGEPAGRRVLSAESLELMRKPHGSQLGAAIWGLGTMLYAPNGAGDYVIGHDGNNEPAINTAVRVDPVDGDAIVVLETGNALLATELAGEWVLWKTGTIDFLTFTIGLGETIALVIGGWVVILIVAAVIVWRRRRARYAGSSARV